MATMPLDPALREEYLLLAEDCRYVKEMAERSGIAVTTFKGRLQSLGIRDEVRAILAGRAYSPTQSSRTQPSRTQPSRAQPEPHVTGADSEVTVDVEGIRRAAERRYDLTSGRAEEKKHQSIRFPHGPVAIFFVGDIHFGNAGTDVGRVFREQEQILATPASYVWMMGDTVDNFIMGRLVAENMKPSLPVWEQWQLAKHYVDNYGKRLVAFNNGNHDMWTFKLTGIDYSRDITPEGVLYDSDEVRATVRVGSHDFRVWTRHKWRGSSIYNVTHGQERAARFDSSRADVYVGAHIHRGAMAREFILDGERKVAVQTGAYKQIDSYARSEGFGSSDASTAAGLVLNDDGTFFATANIGAVMNYMKACYRS